MVNIEILAKYVAAAKEKDKDAFTALFQSTKDYTYSIAMSLLSDTQEAQDVVQEVYLRVWLHLPDLREDRSFLRWLHSITFNISRDHLAQRAQQETALDAAAEDILLQKSTFDEWILKSWKQDTIRDMVGTLPDEQKEAIYLFYFQDRTVGEIASIQNCSINTVKSRLFYARNTLQKLIEAEEKRTGRMHLSPVVIALTSVMLLPMLQITLPHAESMRILLSVFTAAESMSGGIAYTSNDDVRNNKPLCKMILSFIRGHWTVHLRSSAVIGIITAAILAASGLILYGRTLERHAGMSDVDIPKRTQNTAENMTDAIQTAPAKIIVQGTCGDEASFTITDDGILTVSGNGKIGILNEWRYADMLTGEDLSLFSFETLLPYREFITEIIVEEGIDEIGYAAFSRVPNLKTISLPDSCTVVGAGAFYECTSLTEFVFPPRVENIEDVVLKNCISLNKIAISEAARYIGGEAFNGCLKLESVEFRGKVLEEIGGNAFAGLPLLKELHLPDSVTKIHTYAITDIGVEVLDLSNLKNTVFDLHSIRNCTYLRTLILPEGSVTLPSAMVHNCSALREITIGEGTRIIEKDAFSTSPLTKITIPAGVVSIEGGAFCNLKFLTSILVDADNPNYCDVGGILYTRSMNVLHTYPAARIDSTFVIPESVHTVGPYAFTNNENLTTLSVGSKLNVLSHLALIKMPALTGLYFCDGAPLIWDDHAVERCEALTLYFPEAEEPIIDGMWTAPNGSVFQAKYFSK